MPFEKKEGIPGLVYVPECKQCEKKHNCPDCFSCQWCDDSRCDLCLNKKKQDASNLKDVEKG